MSAKSTSLNTFEWLGNPPRLANATKTSALNCVTMSVSRAHWKYFFISWPHSPSGKLNLKQFFFCGLNQADDMICELQCVMREGLAVVVETEMRAAYEDLW